jgi:hypothetical protein
MKYTIIINYLLSNSIQPTIEREGSIPTKSLAKKDAWTFKSGKFCHMIYSAKQYFKIIEMLIISDSC